MQLVLIGMSGVGKSTWARRLGECGYRAFHCDEAIAARIGRQRGLRRPLTDAALGSWLGMPDAAGYAEREALYLHHEAAVLHEAVELLAQPGRPTVVDTSGSAIYCGAELFAQLRQQATVLYLPVSPADHRAMLAAYLRNPRPVIWNGVFKPQAGEERRQSFARCYPELVRTREALYDTYCHRRIPPETHRRADLTPEAFLALARGER